MEVDRQAYTKLIDQDIAVLSKFLPDNSLELDHIKIILKLSIINRYKKQEEYNKYEFCKALNCAMLYQSGYRNACDVEPSGCLIESFTEWLKENNYKIINSGE